MTQSTSADLCGVPVRAVRDAAFVLRREAPELLHAVETGALLLSRARRLASADLASQRKMLLQLASQGQLEPRMRPGTEFTERVCIGQSANPVSFTVRTLPVEQRTVTILTDARPRRMGIPSPAQG